MNMMPPRHEKNFISKDMRDLEVRIQKPEGKILYSDS